MTTIAYLFNLLTDEHIQNCGWLYVWVVGLDVMVGDLWIFKTLLTQLIANNFIHVFQCYLSIITHYQI